MRGEVCTICDLLWSGLGVDGGSRSVEFTWQQQAGYNGRPCAFCGARELPSVSVGRWMCDLGV